jgi:alkanesulfonate monooxygenase SsuD/methylene tetrahydromethanopterin reductase-like flavin-dependent oxidoreductase (luciferase family)
MNRVLFGLDVPASIETGRDPIAAARSAEALGFDFVSANDHILGSGSRYEAWSLLSWLAASTSQIRIATRVLGVPYREPVLVAKMAETFDRLSGGRLILGLGAGSGEAEFEAMGLEVRSVTDRVQALEEAIQIIRGLWSGSSTHEGARYRTVRAEIEPKPSHAIPIWLGTVGRRGLELTGRLANGWVPSLAYAPPERAPAMIERIIATAAAAGRNPDEIARIYNVEVSLSNAASADVIAGNAEAIADRLLGFVMMGFTGFNLLPVGPGRDEQIERLGREVVPAVRSGA